MKVTAQRKGLIATRFGKRLKAWRLAQKLPMKHIAVELGVSVQIVSDWERGRRFPSEHHLSQLSGYCDRPICSFFSEEDCAHLPS